MTNLQLPVLRTGHLIAAFGLTEIGKRKRIAYETHAERTSENFVTLYHHGNAIATLGVAGEILVTNAGWQSRTTANRLDRILTDNQVGSSTRIRIQQGDMVLQRNGITIVNMREQNTVILQRRESNDFGASLMIVGAA